MDFRVSKVAADKQPASCIVVAIYESRRLSPAAQTINDASHGELLRLVRRFEMQGSTGDTLTLNSLPNIKAQQVLLVGSGKKSAMGAHRYGRLLAAGAKELSANGVKDAAVYLAELEVEERDVYWKIRQIVETMRDAVYRFDQLKSDASTIKKPKIRRLVCAIASQRDKSRAEEGIRHGMGISDGVDLARDLGNLPGNICTPTYLADYARQMARSHKAIKVRVLGEPEMKRLGMGTLLSVARGSQEPARLITLEYNGSRSRKRPAVLIGKGVTFDSGGISIKPAAQMDEMKFDMCGAAAVLGATKAAIEAKLPLNVITIVAAAENMPSGNASRPGDIVTTLSGQTVEILNTDAEGRLVLCDALTYAERYKPKAVVDVATLTGAIIVALGAPASGLFSNDETLAQSLLDAGQRIHDRAWRMPIWDDYQQQLKSNFADMANIGGREASSITAACFLSRFAKQFPWAHLDVAASAFSGGANKGASGRPVPLLFEYLLHQA